MSTSRFVVLVALLSLATAAQGLEVITVPWVAAEPAVPHLAYNGHATTFKAIARGGNGTYLVEWDFDGNGTWDLSSSTTDRYDLSARFTFANQAADVTFLARVQVTSNAEVAVATYPVRVFADVPADPSTATDRQLQVMRGVAIDDGLWFLHTQLTRVGDETNPVTGAQVTGWLDPDAGQASYRNISSGSHLEALGLNGHFPAFPTAYLGELPDPAANAARWAGDPYAEDAARLVNHLLTQALVVSIAAPDESNLTGFYPEVAATPIPGTDDGFGLHIGYNTSNHVNGPHSNALRGFALAHLTGFVAQVGDPNRVLGRRFEFIVQQLVDGLVWAQSEVGGEALGSWYYTPNSSIDMLGEFAGGTLDAAEALWQAERSLGGQGLIVPNLAKARLAQYILGNANTCPGFPGTGGSFTSSANNVCDFALSAAHVFTWGWLGANSLSTSDVRLAFPGYSSLTRGQLRTQYDGSMAFINAAFNGRSPGQNSWDVGFVEPGIDGLADFGRTDGRGDHWSMLHWTRAAHAVEPEVVRFGSNDHARLFGRYLILNQAAGGGWNWTYSAANPPFPAPPIALFNHSDYFLGPNGRAAWAVITLSRDGMAPVASITASALAASEGTAITFEGSAHAGGAAIYQWSMGNGEAREGQRVVYAFPDSGPFDVTLVVTTAAGTSGSLVRVTIANLPPVAHAGPDLALAEGTALLFAGGLTDPGLADTHTASWSFGDLQSAATLIASHAYADNGVFTATLTVLDDDGGMGSDSVTVTVLNVPPTITSTPATAVQEAVGLTYALAFTDPGLGDTHACTAPVAPAGAVLTGCTLRWSPSFAQLAAPAPVTMCVADDDGGSACQSYELTVTPVDTDADGLPDSWETHFFGNLTSQSGAGDADLDGVGNREEFLAGTSPISWGGPGVPVLLSPACDSKVTSTRPVLLVANSVDPRGSTLTYEFELHGDAAMTSLVAAGRNVSAGAGYTGWQVSVDLVEDRQYFWRARAGDGAVSGAWTLPACAVTVDMNAPAQVAPVVAKASGCGCSGAQTASWPALAVVLALGLLRRGRVGLRGGRAQGRSGALEV